jgi:aconitate hydratase
VKTSLAPGSQVVTDYLEKGRPAEGSRRARLQPGRLWLHHLHRQLRPAARTRSPSDQRQTAIWSPRGALGQPQLRRPRQPARAANYLASPPLVVAYALAGTVNIDLTKEPLGTEGRQAGLPEGHLADEQGDRDTSSKS